MRLSRTGAVTAVSALAAGLLVAIAPAADAAPTPPPNPTNGQITAAQAAKNELANRIGVLSAQVAQARAQLVALEGKAELAEQLVALRESQLREARVAATAALAKVKAAAATVDAAHTQFVRYVQATYMNGVSSSVNDTPLGLLTAKDPASLLDTSVVAQYQANNKIDAIGRLQAARVGRSNADAAARAAVARIATAKKQAVLARRAAVAAVEAQRQQEATLEANVAATQTALEAAQAQLATLNNQRAAFNAYIAEQRRLAAIRAAKERARKLALARAKAAAAKAAADAKAAAARRHHNGNSGGGGGGGGGQSTDSGPSAPVGGSWTAAKGRAAVARAKSRLGTPYAWAGGGAHGSSYGVCDSGAGAPNDCYVRGFDCSGLAMYAWGIGWHHYAATQYGQAGSYHPSRGNLMPGDLVFYGPSRWGIHHVAIYAGNGMMVEAPYSGGYVQISAVDAYYDYYGATRPLT